MKKFYIFTVLLSIYQITLPMDPATLKENYRKTFDQELQEKRKQEDQEHKNNKQKLDQLKQKRAQEDLNLKRQRAIEDGDTDTLKNLRNDEDAATTAKRRKEDQKWDSWFKNKLGRDKARAQEDKELTDKRTEEDQRTEKRKEINKKDPIKLNFDNENEEKIEIEKIQTASKAIDHLLINHEFKTVMSRLVDIESYQTMYHSLTTGTIDIESLKNVQKSLKSDITFSPEELKLLKNHKAELDTAINHINSLFDTIKKNPVYETIQQELQNHQPPFTIDDTQTALKRSIDELKKINFDIMGNLTGKIALHTLQAFGAALISAPLVVLASSIYIGKGIGLFGGAVFGAGAGGSAGLILGGGAASLPAAIGGTYAGAVVGGAIGEVGGAALGALVGAKIAIFATPIIIALRVADAMKNYEYTIKRSNDSYSATIENSKKAILSPENIRQNIKENFFNSEKMFFDILTGKSKTKEISNEKTKKTDNKKPKK